MSKIFLRPCMWWMGACLSLTCMAQKEDYIWLMGYESAHAPLDTAALGYNFGNVKLDFNCSQLCVSYDSIPLNFLYTDASICDSAGNLLFYTNGISVKNYLNETVVNGDSLNFGYHIYYRDTEFIKLGEYTPQGVLILPSNSNKNQYYVIHSFCDTFPGSASTLLYYSKLLYSLVDMSLATGKGAVVAKNIPIMEDAISGQVQAVRHSNGHDWWLLVQKRNTNCFYRILLDSSGFHIFNDKACLGSVMSDKQDGYTCFSPDGKTFVSLTILEGLNIYDFDRCSGNLSNARHFPLPIMVDSFWHFFGLAFSPDSRYLYLSLTHHVYQFDSWDTNIFSTIDTIGVYDGTQLANFSIQAGFGLTQLAPNGKIYISCSDTYKSLHVIDAPDEKGSLCNFLQNGLHLPAINKALPNFPNYRLGAQPGSACDTLSGLNDNARAEKEKTLKIFPNPATDYVVIDYGFTDWNKGEVSLEIQNELGQTVYAQKLPMYSGFQKIDISSFAAGFYIANIKRQSTLVATSKFVKQ